MSYRAVVFDLGGVVLGNLLEAPADGIHVETLVRAPEAGSQLYVRVRQEQGGTAWTSPFFFDPPAPMTSPTQPTQP